MKKRDSGDFFCMTRSDYDSKIQKLKKKFKWMRNFELEFDPGFLGIVEEFVISFDVFLKQNEVVNLEYFGITMFGETLDIRSSWLWANREQADAGESLIDEAINKSKTVCRVCGRRKPLHGQYDFQNNRCYLHFDAPKFFVEGEIVEKNEKFSLGEIAVEASRLMKADLHDSTPRIRLFDETKFQVFVSNLVSMRAEKKDRLDRMLSSIRSAGQSSRMLAILPADWEIKLDELEETFPNFASFCDLLRDQCALSALGDKRIKFAPTLFVGPPGIGKTEVTNWVAEYFKLPTRFFDMASAQTNSSISGSEAYWSNTREGGVFEMLAYQPFANPILVLDEIDKVSQSDQHDPLSALYSLLEPTTARRFCDLSIRDFEIDASHINWIATANSLSTIPKPILSRFNVFEISAPSKAQISKIAKQIYRKIRTESSWGESFSHDLDDAVAALLAKQSPRELRKLMERAFGTAARQGRRVLIVDDFAYTSRVSDAPQIGFLANQNGARAFS
ncbi:AAA family ATPase [Undibacterium sp. Di24W]|uniref:AAA family ATPase n=1 Tax=Undibacterium sp. Di24W TaxID=3413033 RepID=UPI003BF0A0A8